VTHTLVEKLAAGAAQCLTTPKLDVHFGEQLSFTDVTPGLPTKGQLLHKALQTGYIEGAAEKRIITRASSLFQNHWSEVHAPAL
jgi:hypothetical protein